MPLDGPARPHPKTAALARGDRRYKRKVASPKQWQAIIAAKPGPCAACWGTGPYEYHHLLSRAQLGDDVADNLVPLCRDCHRLVTDRDAKTCRAMLARLTDAEYAYCIDQGGEDIFERAYGLVYERSV